MLLTAALFSILSAFGPVVLAAVLAAMGYGARKLFSSSETRQTMVYSVLAYYDDPYTYRRLQTEYLTTTAVLQKSYY